MLVKSPIENVHILYISSKLPKWTQVGGEIFADELSEFLDGMRKRREWELIKREGREEGGIREAGSG